MADEFTGTADLGTGGSEQVVQQTNEVQGGAGEQTVQTPDNQQSTHEQGLVNEVTRLRDELKRKDEYLEFVRASQQYQPQQAQQVQQDDIDLKPNDIPEVADVERIAEKRARALFQEMQAQEQSNRMEAELRSRAEEIRKTDTNFDNRINLAIELMQRDPYLQSAFARETSAEGKIKALEKIAVFHPLYESYKPATVASKPVDDAIKKLQENAKLPQTLSGVQGSGQVIKQASQMTDEEYIEYLREVQGRA